jgi:hypothetical protein
VSAVRPPSSSRATRTLAALERELPTLLATCDSNGLLRLQALAQVLAQQTDGNLHRRAARIAKKAGAAAAKAPEVGKPTATATDSPGQLDGNGQADAAAPPRAGNGNGSGVARPAEDQGPLATSELERGLLARAATSLTRDGVVPGAAAPRPAGVSADGHLLFARLATLLTILARDDAPEGIAPAALRELVVREDSGVVHVALPAAVGSYWSLLLAGYDRARVLPGKLVFGVLRRQHQRQIRRELKQIAVDSLSSGTDVRALTMDAVPAVAYALLIGRLPTSIEDGSPEAVERVNDLFLSVSHDSAALPPAASSPVFLDLFKLAVALGEAERYAAQLALVGLQGGGEAVQQSRPSPSPSRRRLGVALALGAGALVAALVGFAIGMADTQAGPAKRAALARETTTIARTDTVTRTETITRTADPRTSIPAQATHVAHHKTLTGKGSVPEVTTVTVTTPAAAANLPASTVTVTTAAKAAKAPVPAVRVKDVVPASCASAVDAARSIALLAANSFGLFADYATLASEAVPAAINRDAAKMGSISSKTNSIAASLKAQADQIARLANDVSAGVTGCQ